MWTDKTAALRILIIGDIMIDRYIKGSVDRISPEAPVPVITHHMTEDRLGGAANVALNVQALGAQAYICSLTGKDENGRELTGLLKDHNISPDFIGQTDERMTTVKTRVLGNNQHMLRVDREDTHNLSKIEEDLLLENLQKALIEVEPQILILQDYNKGLLTPGIIKNSIREAKARGIFVAVDPKNHHFFDYKEVDLFKPNLKEISQAFNIVGTSDEKTLLAISRELRGRLQNRYTLITLSDKGLFIDDGSNHHIVPPNRRRNIVDVCGAGDTVLSIASILLYLGVDLQEVGHTANAAGGQVCERVGVVPIDKELLLKELTIDN